MTAVKSWMEISAAALAANLRAIQVVAGKDAEVLAVVKANGYGHDAALVAGVLVQTGVKWLGVSDVQEGVRVRRACPDVHILVMCGMDLGDAPALVEHGLTPVVWTLAHVDALERAAEAAGRTVAVHVEIDTGMSRQGIMPGTMELPKLLERLVRSRWVECEGLMSHLCCSEIRHAGATDEQRRRLGVALQQASWSGVNLQYLHLANTSALDEGSTTAWVQQQAAVIGARVMVRPGLAIYGHCLPVDNGADPGNPGSTLLLPRLCAVETWKTRVIDLRQIEAGTTVGYGATFVASKPTRLALLPVGYADGFRREASSGAGDGWVMIAGRQATIVGRVSMNLMSVDVTGIDVALGDEVVLLGEGVTAEDHARWCGTIAYEILCGARARVVVV
jgi:alanine racemase